MFRVLVLRSSTPVLPVVSEATHFAPSGREAREQIRELLLPERSVQAARAVAHLGVEGNGSSLTMHVMTNPKLSIGKLIRLISRHGKTGVVEHAMYSVLSKLNDSMKEKRAELDASVTQESDFLDWQTKRQHMSIVDHLERQLKILSPYIEIKQVRKSGKMYNVPVPIATEVCLFYSYKFTCRLVEDR